MTKSTTAHFERFPSEFHMLRFFGKYLPKLDVMASAKMVQGVYLYDGELKVARHFQQFLTEMEALTGLSINIRASTQRLNNFIVFFDEVPKDAAEFVEASVKVDTSKMMSLSIAGEETLPVVTEEVNTNFAGHYQAVKSTVGAEVKTLDVQAVIKEAEALRDTGTKQSAKQALEEFGIKLGASLTKSKTFDNMMEELKAFLTA